MLTAPAPSLTYEDQATGFATLEKPIDVLVTHALVDNAEVGPEGLSTSAYFVYRRSLPGAALDIWDDGDKRWTSEMIGGARIPMPLGYQPQEVQAWKGIIIGAGGRDADGQPQFAKATGGYPQYSVRGYFVSKDHSEAFLTGPSDAFVFVGVADKSLVAIGPGENEKPEEATQARLLLKSTALQTIGELLIERDASGARVTIENASGASIVLRPDGRIELIPAPGERIVVSGDLETGHITYLPANSFAKQTL